MFKRFSVFLFVVSLFVPVLSAAAQPAETQARVIISEVKLNDATTVEEEKRQFVELYNATDQAVDLSGLSLEYAKPGFANSNCSASSWGVDPKGFSIELTGLMEAGGTAVFFAPGMNKTTEGSLRVLSAETGGTRTQHDLVGWGTESASAPCVEAEQAAKPGTAKSVQRYVDCDGATLVDTNDNQKDFVISDFPSPNALNSTKPSDCENAGGAACDGVVVSEILPNPIGTDGDHEFIELHNPTSEVIELDGCQLSVSGSDEVFTFANDTNLASDEYKAFYSSDTGLVLPNAAGGEVLLIINATEYPYSYPANMKDDEAWALISSTWQATDNPTPHAPNKPMSSEDTGASVDDDGLDPCPPGKFRNPLTNRCKSIALASAALAPCKVGQIRNPETNRCRSATLASTTLTPCKPGQERNPATNRCRKVESANTLKPCGSDEERNPETNRCRKVPATLAAASVADKQSDNKKAINYGVLGLVSSSVVGYGLYEYRNDFRNKFFRMKSRLFPGKSGK